MAEFTYGDSEAMCSDAYLWPALERILLAQAPPPRPLFELGCGNGAVAVRLASLGYSVTGVDPSRSGIAIASPQSSDTLRFEVASTSEPLDRFGTFPVVVSMEVIEHCPSAYEFMRAFKSLIAPGGIGILTTPYHSYLKNLLVVASGKFDHHFNPLWEGGHLKFFSIATMRQLLTDCGITRFEILRLGRVPPVAKSMMVIVHV